MPQTGFCTDVTCRKELTELYECHCCNWLICLQHLLEHVEITKKDKRKKFENLRNELMSVSCALELIVERKTREIEREKQLINQAKTMIDTTGCSIEEMQEVFEQINQTIALQGKEETVVKVESSLLDVVKTSFDDEILEEKMIVPDLHSSSKSIFEPINSPIYRSRIFRPSVCENTARTDSIDSSADMDNFIIDDITIDPSMDKVDNEREHDQENSVTPKYFMRCPLTFDGAFGVTKAQHSIELCSLDRSCKRNLLSHFKAKHKMKLTYAQRLYRATRDGLDPKTTKLIDENEIIIDYDRFIPCPFSSAMINLVGCCPRSSQKVPCQCDTIDSVNLKAHLTSHHRVSFTVANKLSKSYLQKLSQRRSSNGSINTSY